MLETAPSWRTALMLFLMLFIMDPVNRHGLPCVQALQHNSETENMNAQEGSICIAGDEGNQQCFESEEAADQYYRAGVHYVNIQDGKPQQVGGARWKTTMEAINKMQIYMKKVEEDEELSSVRSQCQCRHELCAFWAGIGECEANPKFMRKECAPCCESCEELDFQRRCPIDKDVPSVWPPGGLNKMFERITAETYYVERYQPTIYSKPPEGPWIVTLENVATGDQCQQMIKAAAQEGFQRSKDVGEQKYDGTFDSVESLDRTSANAWCMGDCYNLPEHQEVLDLVENITGIPDANSEYWQMLRYEEGQFYRRHHDYVPFHQERAQGVRILTVFLYLNDVEEGGGTRFSDLGITVEPRRGRALLWPSVLDKNSSLQDRRTHHEALPVMKGVKYGANGWYHERDFKTPHSRGCS